MMARVRTVTGEIDASALGVTLFHEHLINNGSAAWHAPEPGDVMGERIASAPVRMEFLGRLRNDPYLSLDNCSLDDVDVAAEEAAFFAAAGGNTIVEVTLEGIGRDPQALVEIAGRTGLNIVMGCGFYLERAHPPGLSAMPIDDIADVMVRDVVDGVDGVHAGVIGEIGVGPHFTDAEQRVLRAAARAQKRTAVPLSVHMPGWERYGMRVLDIVDEEGGDLSSVVLAHMNPSGQDRLYQHALADRGAYIEYDMLGMEFYYPGEGQSPSDEDDAAAVAALVADGYAGQVLLSHDVFIKTLLRRYGGFGYAHVLESFVPRLERHGVPRDTALGMLTDNPRSVFESASRGERR